MFKDDTDTKQPLAVDRQNHQKGRKPSARRLRKAASDPRVSRAHAEFEAKLASVCEHARLAFLILQMTPQQLRETGNAADHRIYVDACSEALALYNAVRAAEQKFREVVILGA